MLPGDDSYYGRRYVATNIKLKDNVELRIEEGAILMQSSRAEDYAYEVFLGHDVPFPVSTGPTPSSAAIILLFKPPKRKTFVLRVAAGSLPATVLREKFWLRRIFPQVTPSTCVCLLS